MDTQKEYSVIKLTAKNDVNGNPRRLWMVLSNGIVKAIYDVGYRGIDALPKEIRELGYHAFQISIVDSEYHNLLKFKNKED